MGSATDTTPPVTIAPAPGLRVQLGRQLFGTMPEMADDIVARPGEGEHVFDFARRLRLGETPEEAISLMAFALQPRPAAHVNGAGGAYQARSPVTSLTACSPPGFASEMSEFAKYA